MKKVKIQVIKSQSSKKYSGEVWIDNALEIQTVPMASEIVAIRTLNKKIDEFNHLHETKLPNYPEVSGASPIIFGADEGRKPTTIIEPAKQQPKPKRQARKPFTPYGLNGYFVDKDGNIRLHLDRRANARTITLNADFFGSLAEMVRKTQENMP